MLTLNQQTALYLISEGYSQTQAADAMGVTIGVVIYSLRRARKRLRAKTNAHAAVMLRAGGAF